MSSAVQESARAMKPFQRRGNGQPTRSATAATAAGRNWEYGA